MTSSFSIPLPSDGWVYLTREAYRQFKSKKLLGFTEIRLELTTYKGGNGVYLRLAEHKVKKAITYEDSKSGKHFVQLTL